jgi:hypothetical protein
MGANLTRLGWSCDGVAFDAGFRAVGLGRGLYIIDVKHSAACISQGGRIRVGGVCEGVLRFRVRSATIYEDDNDDEYLQVCY